MRRRFSAAVVDQQHALLRVAHARMILHFNFSAVIQHNLGKCTSDI